MKDQELLIAEYCMLSTANVSDGLDRIGVDGTPHGIWAVVGRLRQDCGSRLYTQIGGCWRGR